MRIASHILKDQVQEALGMGGGTYDIDGIVAEIVGRFGRVDIDSVPSEEYWGIVARHDVS